MYDPLTDQYAEVHTEIKDRHEECRLMKLEELDRNDYLGDYGDGDSDREMLRENYNTIFEKNMEDNW